MLCSLLEMLRKVESCLFFVLLTNEAIRGWQVNDLGQSVGQNLYNDSSA